MSFFLSCTKLISFSFISALVFVFQMSLAIFCNDGIRPWDFCLYFLVQILFGTFVRCYQNWLIIFHLVQLIRKDVLLFFSLASLVNGRGKWKQFDEQRRVGRSYVDTCRPTRAVGCFLAEGECRSRRSACWQEAAVPTHLVSTGWKNFIYPLSLFPHLRVGETEKGKEEARALDAEGERIPW